MLAQLVLLTGTLLASAAQDQQPAGDLALEIALRTYHVDDRVRGSAGDHGVDPFQSYVWTNASLCQVSASDNEPSSVPAIGWHFSGRVVERSGDEFLVSIEWRRLWFNTMRLTDGPTGSMQVRMKPDRRLELDVVGPLGQSTCGMASARLEAAIVSRPRMPLGPAVGARGGGGGGAGGGRGGGAGAGSVVSRPLPNASFLADLWLMHKLPDGTEEFQRYTASFGEDGTPFKFPTVSIAGSNGPVPVDVSGRIRPMLVNESATLSLMIDRSIGRSLIGGSYTTVPLPAPGEVLSFELPPPRRGPDPVEGHRFSLRLRITQK